MKSDTCDKRTKAWLPSLLSIGGYSGKCTWHLGLLAN